MPSFESWFASLTPEEQKIAKANLTKAEPEPEVEAGPPLVGTARIAKGYAEAADPSEVRRQRREGS